MAFNMDMCSMLGPEVLRALFLYAWKVKGLKPRDLGVTPSYANMIKRGKRSVSRPLFEWLLQALTAKDLLETLLEPTLDGAAVAQLAERRPGKAEVPGSNPGGGSTYPRMTETCSGNRSLAWYVTLTRYYPLYGSHLLGGFDAASWQVEQR